MTTTATKQELLCSRCNQPVVYGQLITLSGDHINCPPTTLEKALPTFTKFLKGDQ